MLAEERGDLLIMILVMMRLIFLFVQRDMIINSPPIPYSPL